MLGCGSITELLNTFKKANKEKKFCHKILKLVKEVEGKKPDTYKECWRWVRGLLHDFINLKKLLGD